MVRETVTISAEESAALDRLSKLEGRHRSELLTEAVRQYLSARAPAGDWKAQMRTAFGIWSERLPEEIDDLDRGFRDDFERRLEK
jgi:metal-responsive CopG/Arc/MetJ family transcriptional regulator